MVTIVVKELVREFENKEMDVAQVKTDDGRTFSIAISLRIQENPSGQDENGKNGPKQFSVHSPVECDTSGFMNSSPDSERSGILNPPEFVGNGICNVDDFLNFNNEPFELESQQSIAAANEAVINETECESIADSDCNSANDEYFVIDEVIAKRYNEKTQKYDFLVRPKRYIPKNDVIWSPINNTDNNFDLSLLEHGRLYIEVPQSLKRSERRKKSVLQDKFLSEVNLSSAHKTDYFSPGVELRNSNVFRKLDSSMMIDNGLKFDRYPSYMCMGSSENTMDVEMGTIPSNFEELVPVVSGLIDASHPIMFQIPEQKPKIDSRRPKYQCADCDFEVTVKRKITQHVRTHIIPPAKTNQVRRNIRKKNVSAQNLKRTCHNKANESSVIGNCSTKSKKRKRTKSCDQSQEIENNFERRGAQSAPEVISDPECDSTKLPTDCIKPFEIKSKTTPSRQRVMRKRKRENAPAVKKGQTVLVTEKPKLDQSSDGSVAKRRRCSKLDGEETDDTPNVQRVQKPSIDDDSVPLNVETTDESSKDSLRQGTEHSDSEDDGESLPCIVDSTPVSIFTKKESISVPVSIPLSVLENSDNDIETLKRRLLERDPIINESPAICSTTLPPVLPSISPCSETMENASIQLSDEEIISDVINGIINVLDPEPSTKLNVSPVENRSLGTSETSVAEENPTQCGELLKDVSMESKSCESREPTFPSMFSDVTNVAELSKTSEPLFKCRFCDFIAVGNTKYRKHVLTSHKDRFKKCVFCKKSIMSELSMKQHTLEKHSDFLPIVLLPRLSLPYSSTNNIS